MDDKIYIKAGELGNREKMPSLSYDEDKGSELGYCSDKEALYVGTKNGNVRLCGANDKKTLDALGENVSKLQETIGAVNDELETILAGGVDDGE